MKATQAFRDQFLPKRCIGKRTLRGCSTTGKKDNIVLIEVDCDDLGDVIILDVPESFQEKFRKNSEHHVIKIDDEDGESRAGVCDMDCDATTSNIFSSKSAAPSANYGNMDASTNNGFPRASAACTLNCADFDEECLFVNVGNIPVKLSKSKRTYSGKALSRNQHGSDYESLSESDCSDCEFMEGSFGELREQWEKASFKRRCETSCHSTAGNKAGTSTANQPGHHSDEEGTSGHSEPAIPQSTSAASCDSNVQKLAEESKIFQKDYYDAKEMDEILTGIHDSSCGSSDIENKGDTYAPDQPIHERSEQSAAEQTELHSEKHCFRSYVNGHFDDSPEKLAEESKCAHGTKGTPYQDFENDHPAFLDREQSAVRATIPSENSSCGHKSEAKSALDQNIVVTDRQKIKETDEYKRAMEEEEASRQQQLQLQAEEAQRLRSRKRAEKMRIMANERRQKQRLEEIRETRRKDEENLNLKDKLRAQIKNELCKLETMCGDMASLLRFLGIHVGGGPFPSPNEVQAAYKRACLKFHPDRLTTTDLRQQVEAEEKFKLISNMKEKFSTKKMTNRSI